MKYLSTTQAQSCGGFPQGGLRFSVSRSASRVYKNPVADGLFLRMRKSRMMPESKAENI